MTTMRRVDSCFRGVNAVAGSFDYRYWLAEWHLLPAAAEQTANGDGGDGPAFLPG